MTESQEKILREVNINQAVLIEKFERLDLRVTDLYLHKQRIERILFMFIGGAGVLSFLSGIIYAILK